MKSLWSFYKLLFAASLIDRVISQNSTLAVNNTKHDVKDLLGADWLEFMQLGHNCLRQLRGGREQLQTVLDQYMSNETQNGGCNQFLDVIFVIDSSLSVRETCPIGGGNQPTIDNWKLVLDYVTQVVQAMPLASNQTRIGVVTFSNSVDESHVIPLTLFNESTALSNRISSLPFIGHNTNMTGALRYASRMLTEAPTSGTSTGLSSRQCVVLLTDGMNNVDGDPVQEARLIKLKGYTILVVGITEYVDDAELQEIASPPFTSNFLHANDFSHLNLLVGQALDQLVCNDRPNQPCRDSSIDVVFLLDSSGSISPSFSDGSKDLTNWNLMKTFVATMIENFRVSASETRVGLIRFSNVADVIFKLNTFYSASDAAKAVSQLDFIGSSTNTSDALSVMRTTMFVAQNGARSGVRRVGIVITDGQSDNQPITAIEAKIAKDAGIEMFAIGLTNLIDVNELKTIASSPIDTHYYNRTTFALVSTVTSQLLWSVCHKVCNSSDSKTLVSQSSTTPSSSVGTNVTQQQLCSNVTSFCAAGEELTWIAYPGNVLLGLNYATLSYVSSASQCQSQCQQDFACRSITYVRILQSCSVSYYTKDDAPASSFRIDSAAEYYELSCFYKPTNSG